MSENEGGPTLTYSERDALLWAHRHGNEADLINAAELAARRALAAERARTAEALGDPEKRLRDLTGRLGFGDGITEPQADNDTIVEWVDQESADARELREREAWRIDCHLAGHPDDEDCPEHDPDLRRVNAEAALARVRALVEPGVMPDGESLPEWVHVDELSAALGGGSDG